MSNLIPVVITDKNGRTTTVHKKPDASSGKAKNSIPAPVTQNPVGLDAIHQMKDRIDSALQSISSADQISRCFKRMSLEMLESMDKMTSARPSRVLVDMIEMRSLIHRPGFAKWMKGMEATITKTNLKVTTAMGDAVAGVVDLQDHSREFSGLTDDQFAALTRLSIAASEPEVEFGLVRHARSEYGRITQHPDLAFMDFVLYDSEEVVTRVIEEIEQKRITRRSELEAFLEGGLSPAMVSGVL
jgi:hypothetical protein